MSEGYHHEDEVQQRAYDRQLVARLFKYIKPYKLQMVAAALLLLTAALLSNFVPWLIKKAIDWYVNNPERLVLESQIAEAANPAVEALHAEQMLRDKAALLQLVLLTGGLMFFEAIARYMQTYLIAVVGQKTMLEMRVSLFSHLQRMSLRFLDRNPVGRLMTRVTNDVEKIQQTFVSGMVEVFSDTMTIVVVLGYMFWDNAVLASVTLTTVPLVFATSYVFRKFARGSYLEIRRKVARLNTHMQETVSGLRIVQMFNREKINLAKYDALNADHRDEWFRQIRNYAVYFPLVDGFGALAIALIILFHGWHIVNLQQLGLEAISIGTFFAYVLWADRLYSPIRALADRYNMLLEAMAASERIFQLLDTPAELLDKDDAQRPEDLRGQVDFDGVWFAYDNEEWVLKDINFSISPGERVAIVGHTGAGKTTLINLLSRFYDVQQGSIRIDGVDVRDYEKATLRRHIGVVLQDVFLFSGSIERNIRLDNPALSEEHMRRCAEYVNAARFINKLPGQYAYDVGERGANLSTGQRQLLAFARALAHDPDILILDEATSSVDTETEMWIEDAIHKLLEDRTCIVIAHRLSTVQYCDRIIVMHHGEVREMGTHRELIEKQGIYYRLYQLQYKDQHPAA